MKSTSIHSYNADRGLNLFEKIAYIFLNWVNNLGHYISVDKRISISPYEGKRFVEELNKTNPNSSVARRVSDLFWQTLPWEKIKEELGEIHIFDTGCGSGGYGLRIHEASGGMVASYTGIDAKEKPNWKEFQEKHPQFKLIKSSSSDIRSLIPAETNLFITQSAIEHFDEDLLFFEQIKEFIDKTEKPVLQIHVFPAAATLPLYIFHGLRQYNPRTVSKITRIFSEADHIQLFGLGGNRGKWVHFKYVTWPLLILRRKDKRSDNIELYDKEVREAIVKDLDNPTKSPIFWALVMQFNSKRKIF